MRRAVAASDGSGGVRLSCGHRADVSSIDAGHADCADCDRRLLPDGVIIGRRTPTFGAATVPAGLRRDHRTSAWARLEVEVGSVAFRQDDPPWEATATPTEPVVIVPDCAHRVEPSPDARFAVQFYDRPTTPPGSDDLA